MSVLGYRQSSGEPTHSAVTPGSKTGGRFGLLSKNFCTSLIEKINRVGTIVYCASGDEQYTIVLCLSALSIRHFQNLNDHKEGCKPSKKTREERLSFVKLRTQGAPASWIVICLKAPKPKVYSVMPTAPPMAGKSVLITLAPPHRQCSSVP